MLPPRFADASRQQPQKELVQPFMQRTSMHVILRRFIGRIRRSLKASGSSMSFVPLNFSGSPVHQFDAKAPRPYSAVCFQLLLSQGGSPVISVIPSLKLSVWITCSLLFSSQPWVSMFLFILVRFRAFVNKKKSETGFRQLNKRQRLCKPPCERFFCVKFM